MAILHVAMFEAVNAVDRKYAPYKLSLSAGRNVSKEAAAAAAAHAVLVALHPDQQSSLDDVLKISLASIADGEAKVNGIALGKEAAAGILALRASDGAGALETYRPHGSPAHMFLPSSPSVRPLAASHRGACRADRNSGRIPAVAEL